MSVTFPACRAHLPAHSPVMPGFCWWSRRRLFPPPSFFALSPSPLSSLLSLLCPSSPSPLFPSRRLLSPRLSKALLPFLSLFPSPLSLAPPLPFSLFPSSPHSLIRGLGLLLFAHFLLILSVFPLFYCLSLPSLKLFFLIFIFFFRPVESLIFFLHFNFPLFSLSHIFLFPFLFSHFIRPFPPFLFFFLYPSSLLYFQKKKKKTKRNRQTGGGSWWGWGWEIGEWGWG